MTRWDAAWALAAAAGGYALGAALARWVERRGRRRALPPPRPWRQPTPEELRRMVSSFRPRHDPADWRLPPLVDRSAVEYLARELRA